MSYIKRIIALVGVLAVVFGASLVSAGTASATDGSSITVVNQTVTSTAQWNGELVMRWTIKHTKKQKHKILHGKCMWSDGWNYYSQTDLSKGKHWDTHMHLCRDKKSPTGWVKVGGGQSGSHCWNPATPVGHKPLGLPTLGTITEVRSFASYFGSMSAVSDLYLKIHKVCGEDTIDTTMTAHASASASVLLQLAYKAHGQAQSFKESLRLYLQGSAEASTSVQVFIQCNSTPSYTAPSVSASARACVQPGDTNGGIVDVVGNNPNSVAAPGSIVFDGRPAQDVGTVAAGGSASANFGYVFPGTYQVTFTLGAPVNKSATTTVTVNECQVTPGSIVSVEQPNDVLYGNTRTIKVTGVVPSGQVETLKSFANIGSIASADQSITVSGDFTVYVHYTAPTEGSSDTFTVKLFSSSGHLDDQKSVTFGLTAPVPDTP